jgi:RNA 2',3'-cyclic 3'-phosphodiesterase
VRRSKDSILNAWPKRPLYLMAKPPIQIADQIWQHWRTDKRRPPDLLHVTVLPLVDLALFPAETVNYLCGIMAGFEAAPFRLIFDRIEERRAVAMRGSEQMRGAQALQKKLAAFLRANGFPFIGQMPDVHLTINYRRDCQGVASIDPVSWTVEELLLVESLVGEATHIVHGRWPLNRSDGRPTDRLNNDSGTALFRAPARRLSRLPDRLAGAAG